LQALVFSTSQNSKSITAAKLIAESSENSKLMIVHAFNHQKLLTVKKIIKFGLKKLSTPFLKHTNRDNFSGPLIEVHYSVTRIFTCKTEN